jgi:hypothetical protein
VGEGIPKLRKRESVMRLLLDWLRASLLMVTSSLIFLWAIFEFNEMLKPIKI